MLNNFISPYELPFIHEYKRQKEQSINSLVNNLKISDVKETNTFNATATRIKNTVLIKRVDFNEPKFIDHEFEERTLTIEQKLVGGMSKNHYIHQIEFTFIGDTALFRHSPESFSQSSSDYGLILPTANRLSVYVDLSELNPQKAISEARNLLSMTFQFIEKNNDSIAGWNVVTDNKIQELLNKKREELLRLFG